MNYLQLLYCLTIMLVLAGCNNDDGLLHGNVVNTSTEIHLTLDLEDNLTKYNNEWYRWDIEIEDCNPSVNIRYNAELNGFVLKFCEEVGTLIDDSAYFDNGTCSKFILPEIIDGTEGEIIALFKVDAEFFYCLFEEDEWVEVVFKLE